LFAYKGRRNLRSESRVLLFQWIVVLLACEI
jgi:hypothetical protein